MALAMFNLGGTTTPFATGGYDPFVAQQQQLFQAQSQADAARLAEQVRRALIDFGGTPDFGSLGIQTQTQPWAAHITPEVQALAQQNTAAGTSLLARLQKAHADQQRTIKNQLAARGILTSGETVHQMSEEDLRNRQAIYDASRQLLDFLSGAYAAAAEREQQRQFALLQAQQEAAIRQQELAFRQQQMAMERQMAAQAAAGGGGFDVEGFINDLLGGIGGGGAAAAPMPSAQEIAAAHSVSRKAARHRSEQEKQLLRDFNARYGPIGQYL